MTDAEQTDFWARFLHSRPWRPKGSQSRSRVTIKLNGAGQHTDLEPDCLTEDVLESSLLTLPFTRIERRANIFTVVNRRAE